MRDAIEPFAAAVRPPSPSRLRAGGTIGVSAAEAAAALAGRRNGARRRQSPRRRSCRIRASRAAWRRPGRPTIFRPWGPLSPRHHHAQAALPPQLHPPAPQASPGPGPAGRAPAAPPMFAGSGTVIDAPALRGDRTEGMPQPYVPRPVPTAAGAYAHAAPALGHVISPRPGRLRWGEAPPFPPARDVAGARASRCPRSCSSGGAWRGWWSAWCTWRRALLRPPWTGTTLQRRRRPPFPSPPQRRSHPLRPSRRSRPSRRPTFRPRRARPPSYRGPVRAARGRSLPLRPRRPIRPAAGAGDPSAFPFPNPFQP